MKMFNVIISTFYDIKMPEFWKKCVLVLSTVINKRIPLDVKLCVLNYTENKGWPHFKGKNLVKNNKE